MISHKTEMLLYFRNLSHNLLSGPVGDAFTGLRNLRQLYASSTPFRFEVDTFSMFDLNLPTRTQGLLIDRDLDR